MQKARITPTTVTLQSLFDAALAADELERAKSLYAASGISIQIKIEGGKDAIDCHNLSHGAACIQLLAYLEDNHDQSSFIVITGQGKHERNEAFAMRDQISQFVENHLSDWKAAFEPNNPGRLLITKA